MQGTERRGGNDGAGHEFELPRIVLEITRGRAKHKCREIRSRAFLIGTAPDCDLVLGDSRFDAVHSYVFVSPSSVTIRQLGWGPQLCIDGQPTAWASLADRDRLEMGPYAFQVRIEWPQANRDASRAVGPASETLPVPIDPDRAIERLLRKVEQHSAGPQLSLFVGDDDEAHEPLSRKAQRDGGGAWRQAQKRVSL